MPNNVPVANAKIQCSPPKAIGLRFRERYLSKKDREASCEGHDVGYRNAWTKELDLHEPDTDFSEGASANIAQPSTGLHCFDNGRRCQPPEESLAFSCGSAPATL